MSADIIPTIFSARRRAAVRARAFGRFAAHDFLHARMVEDMLDRLADVRRDFRDVLIIGCPDARMASALRLQGANVTCVDPGVAQARAAGGVHADEDALPFADDHFDLILACGTLDSVNDLPGALVLIRRALRPDGLMLASLIGAGSLPRLRRAMLAADGDRPAPRLHPQIDVRAAGDLLARAGFAMPVADIEPLGVRYPHLLALIADLRGMGATNMLAAAPPPLTRDGLARAVQAFAADADPDGKTRETFMLLHMSGWKPAPNQPKPARRGSATASLSQALKDRS